MPKGSMVITGASTGIGREIAIYMANAGFHVFAGVRKEADGESLRQEMPGGITPIILDVTDSESIANATETVANALAGRPLTGLINNAGITIVGPLEFLPQLIQR